MSDALADVIAYHQATKHQLHAYARGPSQMDWATQPNPFRRYEGAPLIALDRIPPSLEPPYDAAFAQLCTHRHVSQLFSDSLERCGLSAEANHDPREQGGRSAAYPHEWNCDSNVASSPANAP